MSDSLLKKILHYGIPAVLVTPLIIGESLIFPMITTKAFFFYLLVDVLLFSYLLLLRREALFPRKSTLFLFFLGMTLLSFLIDLLGINFKQSFWGNYERMMGIYTSIHFLLYLWILLSIYNTKEKFQKLLDVSVVVSVLVGIYGFLQKIGVDWWGVIDMVEDRLQSTLGNAAFLGGYALIHLFIIFYLFWKRRGNLSWQGYYAAAFAVNLAMLFFSGTRGALLGLAAAVFCMLVLLAFSHERQGVKRASIALLVISVVAVASLFVFKDSSLVQNNFTLRRITQSSFTEGTGQSRVLLWKMSIAASMERPVFGYGANNMRIPLDRHHDYNLQEDWFDSAHNKFFDELLSHGFVGLLIYLAFLILVFRHIFGLRKKDLWESLALLGLFVGYVVQSLFIFDSLVVGLLFVFVLAWLFTTEDSKKQIFAKTLRPWVAYLLCAVLVIGGLLVYLRAIPPARDTASAYRMLSQDMGQAIRLFEKVEHQAFFSYDIIAPTMAEGAVMVFSEPERYAREDLERYADLVIRMYRKAIDASGGYSKFYINLAKLYQQFDSVLDNGAYLGESFALLDEAAMISPGRIDVYYARAQGYYNMGDTDQAAAELQKALEFGVRQDKIYMRLAQIYVRKGSAEEFLEAFKAVSETGGSFSLGGLEQYARILVERGVWDGALAVFLKMHELAPNDIDIRFNIALTYKQLGEREKAAEWAGSIIDLNPFKADEMNAFILTL